MDTHAEAYAKLTESFVRWAETEENVRAAIVIGSRARADHPADEWSDLDIILLAEDPRPIWARDDWLGNIGEVWLTFVEPTPDGAGFERRVLFAGGLDVDFAPEPVAGFRQMLETGLPTEVVDIVQRGARVLLDKDDLCQQLMASVDEEPAPPPPPTEPEVLNLVHDFWYHTVWTAKHLRRGELWWAKSCCDSYLKERLLRMLSWHARATRGPETDTWMRGRFLEEWADPRAVSALSDIFAPYDPEDMWRALLATMALFRWVAVETTEALNVPYPAAGDARASELVERLFAERNHNG